MKISFKFFCTAYLSVLLAVGAVGLFFVTYTTGTLLNSKILKQHLCYLFKTLLNAYCIYVGTKSH